MDPHSPQGQRQKFHELIARKARREGVSVEVAKQLMSDRHNKLTREAEEATGMQQTEAVIDHYRAFVKELVEKSAAALCKIVAH